MKKVKRREKEEEISEEQEWYRMKMARYYEEDFDTIIWDKTKPMGDMKRIMDTTRAEGHGFKASTSLKEGVINTIEWYLEKNK